MGADVQGLMAPARASNKEGARVVLQLGLVVHPLPCVAAYPSKPECNAWMMEEGACKLSSTTQQRCNGWRGGQRKRRASQDNASSWYTSHLVPAKVGWWLMDARFVVSGFHLQVLQYRHKSLVSN